MKTTYDKAKVIELIQNAERISVTVEEYNIGERRDYYYDKHSNLFEQMMDDIDNLTFPMDRVAIIRDNHSYNHESTLSEIFNAIKTNSLEDVCENEGVEDFDELEDMTLGEVETKFPSIYNEVIEALDVLEDDDIDIYDDGSTIFDCSYIDEEINTQTLDALAYWTVYFEPNLSDDADIAMEVGLVPFEYDGTFYLALGGCGMDLSPRLDAYVALSCGRLPKDSLFFSDGNYFEYVVGKNVYDKILKKCKLDAPRFTVNFSTPLGKEGL